MKGRIRIVTAAIATLVTCFVFEPSWAARMPAVPSIAVSLAGLNLDKEEDAKVLYLRLRRAAFQVCEQVVGPTMTLAVGKCASGLLDKAVMDVNRPTLTALHGRSLPRLSARR